MQVDTHLITYGTGLTVAGLGFARGYSISAMKFSTVEDLKANAGESFQFTATLLGTGMAWLGTLNSSRLLLERQDIGTAIAVLQATAAAQGVFWGLVLGAAVGFLFQKLFGRFFD